MFPLIKPKRFLPSAFLAPATATPLSTTTSMARTPVYFVPHGGPDIMFETEHLAYHQFQALGLEITQKARPKAVVVSAPGRRGNPKSKSTPPKQRI